jgi:hypothetical protein
MANARPTPVGSLCDSDAKRDAIHVAIVPARARGTLQPGQKVTSVYGMGTVKAFNGKGKPCGVIDPFLADPVQDGENCFVFVYPDTVTGLRHDWEHPSFPQPEPEPEYDYDDGCRGC